MISEVLISGVQSFAPGEGARATREGGSDGTRRAAGQSGLAWATQSWQPPGPEKRYRDRLGCGTYTDGTYDRPLVSGGITFLTLLV